MIAKALAVICLLFMVLLPVFAAGTPVNGRLGALTGAGDGQEMLAKVRLNESMQSEVQGSMGKSRASVTGHLSGGAASPGTATVARVTDMRSWSNPDYTRIVITLDREVHFSHHKLRQDRSGALPERIYIDIPSARIAPGVKDLPIGDGLLKMARIGQYKPDVVRVVLDVENIRDFKLFPLSDPFRIIVDVRGERRLELSRMETSIRPAEPPLRKPTRHVDPIRGEDSTQQSFMPAKIRRVVIDPGHGGHDPGAVAVNGLKEKDVVLELGMRLSRRIKQDLGLDVIMTRSSDVFLPLEERTAIANKVNADLFVSIHANAALNKSASGIETYYLNLAKTDKAARVAARENNTSLEKVGQLQTILFDLMANAKINESARLADDVQKSLCGRIGKIYPSVRNLGVKQGPFYVLLGATMPSILVESGFISNTHEADLFADQGYQDAVVNGIVDGIREYIRQIH